MSTPNAPLPSTPSSEQGVAVITALAANVFVALAKFAAAAITGSSALIAESLHSLADSVNEVLLLIGARRSKRPADLRHPFGHARYRYVYAFVVSLTVFWIGGGLAVRLLPLAGGPSEIRFSAIVPSPPVSSSGTDARWRAPSVYKKVMQCLKSHAPLSFRSLVDSRQDSPRLKKGH